MVGISEISKSVSKKTNTTQRVARGVIKNFLDTIISEADRGSKINLAGFGIFERRKQSPRKARNPQTKKIIDVPAKRKFVLFWKIRARQNYYPLTIILHWNTER